MWLVICLTSQGGFKGRLDIESKISIDSGQSPNFDVCSEGGLGIEEETEREWDKEGKLLFYCDRKVMSTMIMLMSPWPPTPRASHILWLIPPPSTHAFTYALSLKNTQTHSLSHKHYQRFSLASAHMGAELSLIPPQFIAQPRFLEIVGNNNCKIWNSWENHSCIYSRVNLHWQIWYSVW